MSLVLRAPELNAGLQVGSPQSTVEQQNQLPRPAGHVAFMQPRIELAFWSVSAHSWLMFSFSSTSTSKPFLAGLLASRSSPSLYWYQDLSWPMCRTLHLALLNLMEFTQAYFLSLSRSHWMASLPSSISNTPQLRVTRKLAEGALDPTMSLTKLSTSPSPNTDCWGTPFVTNLHLDIESWTATLWMPPSNQFLIHQTVHPSNPYLSNFKRWNLWGTVSNALQKSS